MHCLTLLLFPSLLLADALDGVTVIDGDIHASNIFATFNRGYLAAYGGADGISVYGPSGALYMKIPKRPEWVWGNVDVDSDGMAAVAGFHSPSSGSIVLFNRDATVAGEIVTSPFQPTQVCFAPDHSIWVMGDEHFPEGEHTNYSLLRHYSRSGEPLGEAVPRASFPPDTFLGTSRIGFWKLRIAGGRIGVKLVRAGANQQMLWLETDLNGKETGRWTVPRGAEPSALTESGEVYAQTADLETTMLDRASGEWKPIQRSSNDRILGTDTDMLAFAVRGMNAVRRAAQP